MRIGSRIFGRIGAFAYDRARLLIAAGIALGIASWIYSATSLRLETSRAALISPDAPHQKRYRAYQKRFPKSDDIIVAATGADRSEVEDFVSDVARALEKDREHVASVWYRIDSEPLERKGLLYLDEQEVRDLERRLRDHRQLIVELAERPGLVPLFEGINAEMSDAMVSSALSNLLGSEEEDPAPVDLSLLESVLVQMRRALEGRPYHSPWDALADPEKSEFLRSKGARIYFVLVQPERRPGDFDFAADVLARIRGEVARAQQLHPGVDAGVTGLFALATDEMNASRRDMTIASFIAMGGVFLVFMLIFRELRGPLLAVIALSLSISWTMGFATLSIGYLTVLSVAFTAIVIGLGDDFGMHVLFRFREERRAGLSVRDALVRGMIGAGPGNLAGAVTTSVAFFAVMLAGFRGLSQIGLIAGAGVVLAAVSATFVLPALLAVFDRKSRPKELPMRNLSPRMISWLDRRARAVLVVLAAITLSFLAQLPRLRYDDNLLELQARGTESVEWERRILTDSERSTWYAVSIAPDLEEARHREERLERLPSVETVESIVDLLPQDQKARIERLRPLAGLVEGIPTDPKPPVPIDRDALIGVLRSIQFKLSEGSSSRWAPEKKPDQEAMRRSRDRISEILPILDTARLEAFQVQLFTDFRRELAELPERLSPEPVTLADLPESLVSRFVGRNGEHLLQIYAKRDIWQHENMVEFLGEVRTIDPTVTGAPVQTFEAAAAMRRGYEKGGLYALLVILLVVAIDFRSWLGVGLAFTPVLVGGIWTLGIMAMFDIPLNLANSILLPLLIGIGVDSGIHLAKRHLENREITGFRLLDTGTAWAVASSTLTTMIGFGSLMVAHHRGIFSIGLVLALGVGCILLASLLLVPALLRLERRSA